MIASTFSWLVVNTVDDDDDGGGGGGGGGDGGDAAADADDVLWWLRAVCGRFHALLSAGSTAVNCMNVQPLRDCNLQIPASPWFTPAAAAAAAQEMIWDWPTQCSCDS